MSIYTVLFAVSFVAALWLFHKISARFPMSFVGAVILLSAFTLFVSLFLIQVYFVIRVGITILALAAVAVGVFRVCGLLSRKQVTEK